MVFCDQTGLWWLGLLKRGFRHCFVALGSPAGWLVVEPMSHLTEVTPLDLPQDFDLAGWYRAHGHAVVEVRPATPPRQCAPWRPHSCVEVVKKILGIHAGFVLTPWQLYRHLTSKPASIVS